MDSVYQLIWKSMSPNLWADDENKFYAAGAGAGLGYLGYIRGGLFWIPFGLWLSPLLLAGVIYGVMKSSPVH